MRNKWLLFALVTLVIGLVSLTPAMAEDFNHLEEAFELHQPGSLLSLVKDAFGFDFSDSISRAEYENIRVNLTALKEKARFKAVNEPHGTLYSDLIKALDEIESNLSEPSPEPRFTRDALGVITDSKTNLQWLEGPNRPSSWEDAQEWIQSLGGSWRTPTLAELEGIYLPESRRKGIYGDPLCLDYAFQRESGYSLWSVERYPGTAWMFDFSRGYAHWIDTYFPGHFDRAVAVREAYN